MLSNEHFAMGKPLIQVMYMCSTKVQIRHHNDSQRLIITEDVKSVACCDGSIRIIWIMDHSQILA